MFRLIWRLNVRIRDYLHHLHAEQPTARRYPHPARAQVGLPAMLVAAPYVLIASICSGAVANGGPGWLHLLVLWACWNALKFLIMGPVSVVLLGRARLREAAVRRHQSREALAEASARVPVLRG